MDAKTIHDLVFLAVLSLFCSGIAWAVDHAVFSLVFAALSAVATLNAAPWRWARTGVTMTEENKQMALLGAVVVVLLLVPMAFGAALLNNAMTPIGATAIVPRRY
jgi:hypothetical protein